MKVKYEINSIYSFFKNVKIKINPFKHTHLIRILVFMLHNFQIKIYKLTFLSNILNTFVKSRN